MRRFALIAVGLVLLLGAAFVLAQQQYPNIQPEKVLENDYVVIERIKMPAGAWAGEHSHPGKQFAVVLKGGAMTYREGGEEVQRTFESGEVLWVDSVESHDHKPESDLESILITLK